MRKPDQDFDTMRSAERKRRRKRLLNLEAALRTHMPISSKREPSALWTPQNNLRPGV